MRTRIGVGAPEFEGQRGARGLRVTAGLRDHVFEEDAEGNGLSVRLEGQFEGGVSGCGEEDLASEAHREPKGRRCAPRRVPRAHVGRGDEDVHARWRAAPLGVKGGPDHSRRRTPAPEPCRDRGDDPAVRPVRRFDVGRTVRRLRG